MDSIRRVTKGIFQNLQGRDAQKFSLDQINGDKQYYFNHEDKKIVISTFGDKDPNKTTARVGFIHPWALRPALISRESQFDFFDYGEDLEEWTDDDNYVKAHLAVQKLVLKLVDDSIDPMVIASVLQVSASTLYRSLLTDEEYESFMAGVVKESVKQTKKKTFH